MSFLITVGLISYKVNSSYAIFTDTIKGEKIIEISVDPNLDSCNPNKPVLSENMIAVYYDDKNEVWRKADSENKDPKYKWYDYCDKMWANSVTVTSTNRSNYLSADLGTEIPMNDILTMQVWIPRYKYTVWNYNLNGTATSEPQEIDIEFESGTTTSGEIECTDLVNMGTSDGTKSGVPKTTSETCKLKSTNATCTDNTCNGKTYTHPAFTFGDKELTGFWVGKFEVSSDTECTPASSSSQGLIGMACNLTSIKPLVKPNEISWRGAMVSIFENNIMSMNDSGNMYGYSTTDDIHMMKNMEWGAVAYLSHSKYGINKEIAINSANTYTTGCGLQSEESVSSGTICNSFNTILGQSASTTGNIYGIYDMSGGANEYVMGNMVAPNGTTMISGYRGSSNQYSGYTGILYSLSSDGDYQSYTGSYLYPNDRYYDKYSFGSDLNIVSRSKLGDGIKEVSNNDSSKWYDDYPKFICNNVPWFYRGGKHDDGDVSGIFGSSGYFGLAYATITSRLVISQ